MMDLQPTPRGAAPMLRPYQRDSLEAICHDLGQGLNRLLLKKPTGTGKTVTFAAMPRWPALAAWLAQFKDPAMLVIAHREELLDQAAAKIADANPGLTVSIEQGARYANPYSDVIVASIQTLSASGFRRLLRLMDRRTFRIVIVDEAHHAAAASYRTALAHLGFLPMADVTESTESEAATYDDVAVMEAALQGWDIRAPKDRLLVGVTATPNRSDAIGLGCVFQHITYSYALKQAIEDGWLVPISPWVIETETSLDGVKRSHGDFNQRDLADTVNTPERNRLAVAGWRELAATAQTLAFTVDVQHAHDLAQAFRDAGFTAVAVSGETPKEERRQVLERFRAGTIQIITNCMVFTEGTDLPMVSCILHAKPTESATLYEQMTGRGLRIHPGKTECLVIDVVDIARRFTLQAAPVLYGLPPGLLTEGKNLGDVTQAYDRLVEEFPTFDVEAALAKEHLTLAQLRAKATKVDVWAVRPLGDFGLGRKLSWVAVNEGHYRMTYPWADGNETLDVMRDMLGRWDVSTTLRTIDGTIRQRTQAVQMESANDAAREAEDFIKKDRPSVWRLKDVNAPWKKKPATEGQVKLLRALRVTFNPYQITSGEASALIDEARARRIR